MLYYVKLIIAAITVVAKLPWTLGNNNQSRPVDGRRAVRRSRSAFIAAVLFAVAAAFASGWYTRNDFHYSADKKLILVHHKVFENVVVPLDGYRYVACQFRNITLKYNGTAPYQLEGDYFEGSLTFTTDNKSIEGEVYLLKGTGVMTVPIFDSETGQEIHQVQPPKVGPPSKPTPSTFNGFSSAGGLGQVSHMSRRGAVDEDKWHDLFHGIDSDFTK